MHRSDDPPFMADKSTSLEHAHLQALEVYWRSLRATQTVPARTDLAPAKIERVLPYAFILQRVAAGTARFRVAGQRIHDLIRLDPRGMPLTTLFMQDTHGDIRKAIEAAFSEPAIIGLPLISPGHLLRPPLEGAMLLLPMRDNEGETTRLLGALVTPAHNAQKPRRFMIRDDMRLRHDRISATRPQPVALIPSSGTPQERPGAAKRPALKLVVNNG